MAFTTNIPCTGGRVFFFASSDKYEKICLRSLLRTTAFFEIFLLMTTPKR